MIMKIFSLFILLVFSHHTFAKDGVYLAAAAVPIYGSGSADAKSSLLGTGIALTAGLRIQNVGFEGGVKRLTVTNSELGNDDYDTEIQNAILFGGARLFFSNIFSFKAGLSSHNLEMDIFKNGTRLESAEDDGEYFGIYGGMGIVSPMTKETDLYFESTLYPVSEVDIYFIDIEIGLRFYL